MDNKKIFTLLGLIILLVLSSTLVSATWMNNSCNKAVNISVLPSYNVSNYAFEINMSAMGLNTTDTFFFYDSRDNTPLKWWNETSVIAYTNASIVEGEPYNITIYYDGCGEKPEQNVSLIFIDGSNSDSVAESNWWWGGVLGGTALQTDALAGVKHGVGAINQSNTAGLTKTTDYGTNVSMTYYWATQVEGVGTQIILNKDSGGTYLCGTRLDPGDAGGVWRYWDGGAWSLSNATWTANTWLKLEGYLTNFGFGCYFNDNTQRQSGGAMATTLNGLQLYSEPGNQWDTFYVKAFLGLDGIDNPNMTYGEIETVIRPYNETTTYTASIYELLNATFENNLTLPESITDVSTQLYYNNTYYSTTKTTLNSTDYYFTVTLTTPGLSDVTSIPFNWVYTFTNATDAENEFNNSLTYTQSVYPFTVENCSEAGVGQIMVYNFTFWDEIESTSLSNIDFEATFNISGGDYSETQTYNFDQTGIDQFGLCLNDTGYNYTTLAMLEYFGTSYDIRNYYFVNALMDSTTDDIYLYLLNSSYATGITFKVTDNLGNAKEGDYIKIQRYDVGTDTFKTVAMGRTDTNGEDYIYLRQADAWYRFIVEEDGVAVLTTDSQKITTTTINLMVGAGTSNYLEVFNGIGVNLTYENDSYAFVAIYDDPSGIASMFCLDIWQRAPVNDSLMNRSCVSSSSGTINLTISNESQGTYLAQFYSKVNPTSVIDSIEALVAPFETLFDNVGLDGAYYMFLIVLTCAFVGIWKPSISIFMITLSLIFGIITGLIGFAGGAMLAVGGIAVVGFLFMWAVKD